MDNEKKPLTQGEEEVKGLDTVETGWEETTQTEESIGQRNEEALSAIEQELFVEWYAIVSLPDSSKKWFISTDWKLLWGRLWDDVRAFSEWFAAVKDWYKWLYIDRHGNKVFWGILRNEAFSFHEWYARVRYWEEWYHINKSVNILRDKIWRYVWDFHDWYAVVWDIDEYWRHQWWHIDTDGKLLSGKRWSRTFDFNNWIAIVEEEVQQSYFGESKRWFIDTEGNILWGQLWDTAWKFSKWFVKVANWSKSWYLDTEWNWYDKLPEEE